MVEVIIIGAGGFAKQVIEGFESQHIKIKGLVDDHKTGELLGYPILGSIEYLNHDILTKLFCGIGDITIRQNLFTRFSDRMINCIHPQANISIHSTLGNGNYIGPGACIMPHVSIGHNNIIDCVVVISHDCVIGNHNHLASHSCLLGRIKIGYSNLIGANSTILPDLIVGSKNILGAGAVLTKSIQDDLILIGVPARIKC